MAFLDSQPSKEVLLFSSQPPPGDERKGVEDDVQTGLAVEPPSEFHRSRGEQICFALPKKRNRFFRRKLNRFLGALKLRISR